MGSLAEKKSRPAGSVVGYHWCRSEFLKFLVPLQPPLLLLGRPMVVSSGMQSMETMRCVYKIVKEHNHNFAILQCTSAYPLEAQDVNLRVITVSHVELKYLNI